MQYTCVRIFPMEPLATGLCTAANFPLMSRTLPELSTMSCVMCASLLCPTKKYACITADVLHLYLRISVGLVVYSSPARHLCHTCAIAHAY